MQGDKVVGIDNMIGGVEGNVPDHPKCKYHRGDILDTELMKTIMADCDVVFHTASLTLRRFKCIFSYSNCY